MRIVDWGKDKAKDAVRFLGKTTGFPIIKGYWDFGVDTFKDAFNAAQKQMSDSKELYPDSETEDNAAEENAKNIEKWLASDKKFAPPVLLKGEKYLREREKHGLNLREVDQYYLNRSVASYFFLFCFLYCFGSGVYQMITLGKWWVVTYFATGSIFFSLFLYHAYDAACIYHRQRLYGKGFLTTPTKWFPRLKLPYDWKITDN